MPWKLSLIKHYNNLSRYLLLLFKNELLVEHVAQDIFIYLWENRSEIEINVSLESYIYTAGRYKALNQLRNAKLQEAVKREKGLLRNTMKLLQTWPMKRKSWKN